MRALDNFFKTKKKNPNNIKWIPDSLDAWEKVSSPKPSKRYIPEWYKNIPLWHDGKKDIKFFEDGNFETNATVKKCVPFMDTFLTGYIQELWCDIIFYKKDDNSIAYEHNYHTDPISKREKTSLRLDKKMWHGEEFAWKTQWEPQTPEGYSSLYIHPLNRIDLPFFTLSGIIDTDNWPITGYYPFILNKNFVGKIERGTPIYQIIPMKREEWKTEELERDAETEKMILDKTALLKSHVTDGYREEFWEKKKYE